VTEERRVKRRRERRSERQDLDTWQRLRWCDRGTRAMIWTEISSGRSGMRRVVAGSSMPMRSSKLLDEVKLIVCWVTGEACY
jgi:hypothetical protein